MSSTLPTAPDPQDPVQHDWNAYGHPGGDPLGAAPGEEGQGLKLDRLLAVALRHKWAILTVCVVGTALGVVASRFVKPQFQTHATLWVEISDPRGQDRGPIRSAELLAPSAWIDLLRSFAVLDHVVREQRLFLEPKNAADLALFGEFRLLDSFVPGPYELRVSEDGRQMTLTGGEAGPETVPVGQAVGAAAGFAWTPPREQMRPGRTVAFWLFNPRDAAGRLTQELQANMPVNGNFLRLGLAGTDPRRITSTINELAERYVEVAAELKQAKLLELTEVLEEQRLYAEQNLRDAEIALEEFRVRTITLPSEQAAPVAAGLELTRDPVFEGFFDLRVQRETLRADREALDRALAEMQSSPEAFEALLAIPSLAAAPAVNPLLLERATKRAQLRELLQRYTPEHRQVKALQADLATLEQRTIPTAVRGLREQLVAQEGEIEGQLASVTGELQQIPPRAIEEARLRRRVAIAEELHSTLRQRYEEARLATASSVPDIRILDRASVPYQPVSDNRMMLIVMGFAGSLGLALVGVILLDRLDRRVRYPDQITGLGLPILGLLPTVAANGQPSSRSNASEAFRELRLNLAHAYGTGPLLLTVSSPESGDGKSFVSSNLARTLAEQGQTTVLIDADIRRGRLHHLFQTRRAPGLTDYLAGNATIEQILQPTRHPSIFFIGSGSRLPNGPELLGTPAMSRLILSLTPDFGAVVLDSPPLGAGADAYVLSTLTRNLLVVLRVGQTDRTFAEAKLAPLARLPVRLLGAVLNGTPESRLYRNYRYLPGYEVGESADDSEQPALAGA